MELLQVAPQLQVLALVEGAHTQDGAAGSSPSKAKRPGSATKRSRAVRAEEAVVAPSTLVHSSHIQRLGRLCPQLRMLSLCGCPAAISDHNSLMQLAESLPQLHTLDVSQPAAAVAAVALDIGATDDSSTKPRAHVLGYRRALGTCVAALPALRHLAARACIIDAAASAV